MSADAFRLSEVIDPDSILADLPEDQLDELSTLGQRRKAPAGQTLFQKGDKGDYLAVVLAGRVKISAYSVAGAETVLNLLGPGDVLGEIAAIDGLDRTADAVASEACELLVIPRAVLLRQFGDDPDFALALARALCAKLRRTSEALEATTLDMGGKVAAALLRLSEGRDEDTFEIEIDQTTLANYAGLTRSNVNRVLKRFERAGATLHQKGVLRILDREWLQDFAERDE